MKSTLKGIKKRDKIVASGLIECTTNKRLDKIEQN